MRIDFVYKNELIKLSAIINIQNLIFMRQCYLFAVLILFFFPFFSQAQLPEQSLKEIRNQAVMVDWPAQEIEPATFFEEQKDQLGLGPDDTFNPEKQLTDFIGMERIHFRQEYKGLPVMGSRYSLHLKKGKLIRTSGSVYPGIDLSIQPERSYESNEVIWVAKIKEHLKHEESFPLPASFDLECIVARLCVIDRAFPGFSGSYRLAYELKVRSKLAPINALYYIDATNGDIIAHNSRVCTHNIPATASGYHYRDVPIMVDSISSVEYVLRDTERNIEIRDVIGGSYSNPESQLITTTDNNWTYEEGDINGAAADAMYCTAHYHDMLEEYFDRDNIDGMGGPLICNINVPSFSGSLSFVNAFWDGESSSYGAGDCDGYGPLTTLSIVSHEFTHGLTQNTADLVYADESGALNESMSDIFGETMEYLADSANFSWAIGSKIVIPGSGAEPFRDMSDPNRRGDPKYYKGENWSPSGAVHTNSGVMNYWYYLVANGGSGVNEVGEPYNVQGIGMERAIQIPYLMLEAYLTPTSTYEDAYLAAEAATRDIYGDGPELQAVLAAWEAVGVRNRIPPAEDLAIARLDPGNFIWSLCYDESTIDFPLQLKNTGSDTLVYEGNMSFYVHFPFINLGYEDTVTINERIELMPGAEDILLMPLAHNQSIDQSEIGSINRVEIRLLNEDDVSGNNTIQGFVQFLSDQKDLSLRISGQQDADTDACEFVNISRAYIIANESCESIDFDEEMFIEFTGGGISEMHPVMLFEPLLPGDLHFEFIPVPAIFEQENYSGIIETALIVDGDTNATNDRPEPFSFGSVEYAGELIGFEDEVVPPSLKLPQGSGSIVSYDLNNWLGFESQYFEGIDLFNCYDGPNEFFENHHTLRGDRLAICYNTTGRNNPVFEFKAAMFDAYIDVPDGSEIPRHYSTMFKVFVDGEERLFIYDLEDEEVSTFRVNLQENQIGTIEVEVLTIRRSSALRHDLGWGSWVLLDDLRIDFSSSASEVSVSDMALYPNPTHGLLQIKSDEATSFESIELFNILGAQVFERKNWHSGEPLSLHHLSPGTYMVRMQTRDQEFIYKKIVIQ